MVARGAVCMELQVYRCGQRRQANATTEADPYGMTNKSTGNPKTKYGVPPLRNER